MSIPATSRTCSRVGDLVQRRGRSRTCRAPVRADPYPRAMSRWSTPALHVRGHSRSQSPQAGETNWLHERDMIPAVAGQPGQESSGPFLGWSHRARALECEKMTGASATSSASLMVARTRGKVHEHAEPLHLADYRAAELGQAPGPGCRWPSRPRHVGVVGEGQVPDAEP